MVFKLVRIDTQEPSKILLLTGKHVIGRGRFLHDDDTDKRVSRNHAELEVSEDSISLKSLHQNPCFIIKKSTTETELLQINNTVALTNGDKFGLLPDNFWYEVLHCTAQENDSSEAAVEPNNALNNNSLNGLEDTQVNESNDKQSSDTIVNGGVDEENRVEVKVEAEELNNSESLLNQDTDMYTNPQVPADDASPRKRNQSRSPSPDGLKRVKTEPVTPGGDQAGPSNDSDADQKPAIPTQPVKTPDNLPRRERCIYGANCYRRNPQHLSQFSHPADRDWGAGERGVCPWGAGCRKHDPRHWAQHTHPPGVTPPQRNLNRPGKNPRNSRKTARIDESSDDDSPATDLIVTGKRKRNTLNIQDWSGSESEEDPYNTDGSDEWKPPSDVTQSKDYSQSQDD